MHGQTLQSILDNYKELMKLWERSISVVSETEMKARIRGVQSFIGKFDFLFDCHLENSCCLKQKNLSETIQKLEKSAAEAQSLAKNVFSVLVSDRSDESFQLFWERIQVSKVDLDVDDAHLSRKRKVPSRIET